MPARLLPLFSAGPVVRGAFSKHFWWSGVSAQRYILAFPNSTPGLCNPLSKPHNTHRIVNQPIMNSSPPIGTNLPPVKGVKSQRTQREGPGGLFHLIRMVDPARKQRYGSYRCIRRPDEHAHICVSRTSGHPERADQDGWNARVVSVCPKLE